MRAIVVAMLVALTGCGGQQARWDEAKIEAAQQAAMLPPISPERRAEMDRKGEELQAASRASIAKEQRAAAICNARGEMAQAMYQDRSLLGMDAMLAGIQARKVCENLYQQTGLTPNF